MGTSQGSIGKFGKFGTVIQNPGPRGEQVVVLINTEGRRIFAAGAG